jgi:hypothetical protein
MRLAVIAPALSFAVACTTTTAPGLEPLSGTWALLSASSGVPPRTMSITQSGRTFAGNGEAMGVDVPISISISGTYGAGSAMSPPLVAMILSYGDGGGLTATFSGALSGDTLSGAVTYYGITNEPQSGTLSLVRR